MNPDGTYQRNIYTMTYVAVTLHNQLFKNNYLNTSGWHGM